jgi:hypothetical protein
MERLKYFISVGKINLIYEIENQIYYSEIITNGLKVDILLPLVNSVDTKDDNYDDLNEKILVDDLNPFSISANDFIPDFEPKFSERNAVPDFSEKVMDISSR